MVGPDKKDPQPTPQEVDVQDSAVKDPSQTESRTAATQQPTRRPVAKPNKRTPARRLMIQGLLLAGAAAVGVWTVTLPWYEFHLPTITVVNDALVKTEGVEALGSISGWGLTHQGPAAPVPGMGTPVTPVVQPGSVGGLPQPAFLLAMAGLFGFAAAALRQGFVGLVGLAALLIGWKQLVAFRNVVENPNLGGEFNVAAYGLQWFQLSMLVTFLLTLVVTIQVLVVNQKRRKLERQKALEEGRPVVPTPAEMLQALVLPGLQRLQDTQEKKVAEAKKAKEKG